MYYNLQVFAPTLKNSLRGALAFLFPKIMKILKIKAFDQDVEDFIFSVVRQNLEYREKNNVVRKDFFQLLVQLRNTGNVELDDKWSTEIVHNEKDKKLSIEEIAAQAFIFYGAGFETSSTTASYCLYELAKNQKCQQKAQEEIDRVLQKNGGAITYESISEMTYIEYCIDGKMFLTTFNYK